MALREVLTGRMGPKRDIVLLNSAAALVAADAVDSLREGVKLSANSIDSGSANRALEKYVAVSQRVSVVTG